MKLMRHGPKGAEKPALVDAEGKLRDFCGVLADTGTPPGVGLGHKPPLYLKPGDEMRLGIAGLGEQRQRVHAWDAALIDD